MKVLPLALLYCLSVSAYAESVIPTDQAEREQVERVQTGRYSFVQNIPPVDQLNPLKVVIRTRVPQSINSVGQTKVKSLG